MLKIDLTPSNTFHYSQISNHNFQFFLLDPNLKAMHTPFMCKDYLQDMFWVEYSGKEQEIFGMEWKKGMLDINLPYYFLALTGGAYELQPKVPFLAMFLNAFEDAQGFQHSEVFDTENPKHIVVKFSREWTLSGPILSALTSIIRISAAYEGGDVAAYIKSVMHGEIEDHPLYMNPEIGRCPKLGKRLLALLKGRKVEHSWDKITTISSAHSTGIVGYANFPEED